MIIILLNNYLNALHLNNYLAKTWSFSCWQRDAISQSPSALRDWSLTSRLAHRDSWITDRVPNSSVERRAGPCPLTDRPWAVGAWTWWARRAGWSRPSRTAARLTWRGRSPPRGRWTSRLCWRAPAARPSQRPWTRDRRSPASHLAGQTGLNTRTVTLIMFWSIYGGTGARGTVAGTGHGNQNCCSYSCRFGLRKAAWPRPKTTTTLLLLVYMCWVFCRKKHAYTIVTQLRCHQVREWIPISKMHPPCMLKIQIIGDAHRGNPMMTTKLFYDLQTHKPSQELGANEAREAQWKTDLNTLHWTQQQFCQKK